MTKLNKPSELPMSDILKSVHEAIITQPEIDELLSSGAKAIDHIYNNTKVEYFEDGDKHCISFPPTRCKKIYDSGGERLIPEIKDWLKTNVEWFEIHAFDEMSDTVFVFNTKDDAIKFKLAWDQ